DGLARLLLRHVARQTAALDHEVRDHAMEDRAVEMLVVDVAQEVLDRDRSLFLIQLDGERAEGSLESDHDGSAFVEEWAYVLDEGPHWPSMARSCPARSRCERT